MSGGVVNIGDHGIGPDVVYVGRPSVWGNPFTMKDEADRDRVCDLFDKYAAWRLQYEPEWLLPLRGKVLGCYCAPKRCHAETLDRLANKEECK